MDINAIAQLIGTLGFPIVACVALFWDRIQNEKTRREDNTKFTEAINNNTIAMNRLIDKIDNKG